MNEKNKIRAKELYKKGVSLNGIGRLLDFHSTTILAWVDKDYARKKLEYKRKWFRLNKKRVDEYTRKWWKKNGKNYIEDPVKKESRRLFHNAVARGEIKKKPCEVCGDKNSGGHHPDYSKPLNVIWVCDKHHRMIHKKLGNKQYH